MTVTTQYHENEPNSAVGYSVTVTQTYSSFSEAEIDLLKVHLKDMIGTGIVMKEVYDDD